MKNNNEVKKVKNPDGSIKIILLGEPGVGKSSLINVYNGDPFSKYIQSTFQSSFISKKLTINEKSYEIHIWDTAGQERYRAINKIFIKDSHIVIFVYSITNRKSFMELKFWTEYVDELLGKDITIGIAANKIDLYETEGESVSKGEGQKFADEKNCMFKQTSAKMDREGFENFVNELINKFLSNNPDLKNNSIALRNKKPKKNKQGKCC